MGEETINALMEWLLHTLPPALRGMGFGDPDDAEYAHASDVVAWAIKEIARLREERKPVAWCVQAAAGSMVHAGTHAPIDAAVLIQVKDESEARMLATFYGHRVLAIVEADAREPNRE